MTDSFRPMARSDAALGALCIDHFLSRSDCADLIETFERNRHRCADTEATNPFFHNRFMWRESLPEEEVRARDLMAEASESVRRLMLGYYRLRQDLYLDSVQLVRWDPDQVLPPHADNVHPDGAPNLTPHRTHSSIIFLNDDFEGGALFFEGLRLSIQPTPGLLVMFEAGLKHLHGVANITRGVRYTLPAWYTTDPTLGGRRPVGAT